MNTVSRYVAEIKDSEVLGPQVAHHEVLPALPPRFAETARPWPQSLAHGMEAAGIGRLYSHQAEAMDLARMGRHVVTSTPTASGKSLVYTLPILEECLKNPDACALALFPLKALGRDQLQAFRKAAALMPTGRPITAEVLDGDVKSHARAKMRKEPPNFLVSNPEMVHLSLLPYHASWAPLLASLTHVVVDEAHTYRGVMGSHMAMVFRRLRRVCRFYGADPAFLFSSATLGNPGELCEDLTGLNVDTVAESGAPQGKRHFLFVNPEGSPSTAAIRLLRQSLELGQRTIVYTRSRRMTELISMWAAEQSGEFKDKISAYRAGFLPEERREIESRMASGELLAVVSTSALELGIDIGGLDVCILVGYPGTVMQTLQRGGRVGRKNQESCVCLVAGEDNLDQYFMRHPQDFFARPPEKAVVNPYNPQIMARHLDCAAAELPLRDQEPFLAEEPLAQRAAELEREGRLLRTADGAEVHSRRKRPHREVDLRGSGSTYTIETRKDGAVVGQVDEGRAFKETHPGAVYIHRGRIFVVDELDIPGRKVIVKEERVGYYTRIRSEKVTEIIQTHDTTTAWGADVGLGKLRVTETITGYEKRRTRDGRLLTIVPLDLPPMTFETEGLWFALPRAVHQEAEDARHHYMGGIHAVEHAAIGILPLLVLADRDDLGGISTPLHPQIGRSAVFIYDGHPGGVGLTRQAFLMADELLDTTLRAVADCECELGCPSCVHSPKCGSGNRPIDKDSCLFVLRALRNAQPEGLDSNPQSPAHRDAAARNPQQRQPNEATIHAPSPSEKPAPQAFGVLDVETRRSATEVGGWHRADRMGVACAVLYDSRDDGFHVFEQDRIVDLWKRLAELDLVVGFNIQRFDYKVLTGAAPFDHASLPTLDMLAHVHSRLGYRLSLDCLAQATLGTAKTADGLQSLAWWKEGLVDRIIDYCKTDVAVTRDLYLHGRSHGHLLFTNKAGSLVRLPVEW
ncbi:DEAD/DEAH box helicase [Desulfohalovibrio reitneri]|uniref:DEAD/DEAH box helicase n=1 Tax=Desulfohalovibrio reitneri TaxID=1307759 RepID=UPI0004A78248|nr:DEAD/DEAH box helicase [Desulfohalovibrio reitneri]